MQNKRTKWTPEEDEVLRNYYQIMGSNIPQLNYRSIKSIQKRAKYLGILNKNIAPWTPEEDEILKANYQTKGIHIHQLSYRSKGAIKGRAHRLGLCKTGLHEITWTPEEVLDAKTPWTPEEDEILRANYPSLSINIPQLNHRTASSLYARAHKLGLTAKRGERKRNERWTPEEDELLKNYYRILGTDIPQLSHKEYSSIRYRARKLGLKRESPWISRKYWHNNQCGIQIFIKKYSRKENEYVFKDGRAVKTTMCDYKRIAKIQHPTLKTTQYGAKGTYCNFITKYLHTDTDSEVWAAYYEVECQKCGLKDIMTPQQMQEHFKICQRPEKERKSV